MASIVNDTALVFNSSGTAVIEAQQAGNANYEEAAVNTTVQVSTRTATSIIFEGERIVFDKTQALSGGMELYWSFVDDGANIKMAVRANNHNGWVAVGFPSNAGDPKMIDSDAVLGWQSSVDPQNNRRVGDFYLGGKVESAVVESDRQRLVGEPRVALSDGSVTVLFTRPLNPVAAGVGTLAEAGGSIRPSGETGIIWGYGTLPSSGTASPAYHDFRAFGTIDLESGAVSEDTSLEVWKKAHAALMTLSWGVLLPVGLMMPRFFKHRWHNYGWFKAHRAIQCLGLVCSLAGVLLTLKFKSGTQTLHKGLGITVMVVGWLQPLNALLRKHPHDSWKRKLWYQIHANMGRAAVVAGVANVFVGVGIIDMPGKVAIYVVEGIVIGAFVILQILAAFRGETFFKDPEHKETREETDMEALEMQ